MAGNNVNFLFKQPAPSRVDDFELQTLIYEGPNTLVYQGVQANLQRRVIVKLLKPQVKSRKEWIDRFRREARVCARLTHPNIVDVYTLGEKSGYHYVVMEYVDGLSLKELLRESGALPPEISFSITDQILQALSFVHQHHIVHRDVKPSNILIDWQGQTKLTDFGLAQIADEPGVTQQGSLIGTPSYMAPEQIQGGVIDGRCDLFALGAVIYELLTGEQAFAGENYSTSLFKIMNEDPPPITQLREGFLEQINLHLRKYLSRRPEERWNDAGQAREDLQHLVKQLGIEPSTERVKQTIDQLKTPSHYGTTGQSNAQYPVPPADPQGNIPKRAPTMKWMLIGGSVGAALLILLLTLILQSKESTPAKNEHKIAAQSNSGIGDSYLPPISDSLPDSGRLTDLKGPAKTTDRNEPSSSISDESAVIDSLLQKGTGKEQQSSPDTGTTSPAVEKNSPARLKLSVQPWAKIKIDGQLIESQATKKAIEIAPGQHTITFSHPSFSSYIAEIYLKPGEQRAVHWSFLKNAAHLWVEARPWAEVYVDNQFRDSTPLGKPILLSPGKHFLELKHPQLSSYREFINIASGDTLRLQIALKVN